MMFVCAYITCKSGSHFFVSFLDLHCDWCLYALVAYSSMRIWACRHDIWIHDVISYASLDLCLMLLCNRIVHISAHELTSYVPLTYFLLLLQNRIVHISVHGLISYVSLVTFLMWMSSHIAHMIKTFLLFSSLSGIFNKLLST